ncbi:MAG: MMPL family transporter [Bacteroidetes bacterium]|nr:MMPL family transporter [Bacteroidota bacterium]
MSIFFIAIFRFFKRNRILFFLFLATLLAGVGYFASKIKLEEDISKMLPGDKKVEKLNFVFQNSKFLDKLVVNVSLKDSTLENQEALISFADTLTQRIQHKFVPSHVKEITSKISDELMYAVFNSFYDNLPVFIEDKDYVELDKMIEDSAIYQALNRNYKTLLSPASMILKKNLGRDPLSITPLALKKLQSLQFDDNFEIVDGYIFTKDKKHLLFFITPLAPKKTALNAELIHGLDDLIEQISNENPSVNTDYFGSVAVAVANAERIKKDVTMTVSITVLILFLFISFFFRRVFIFFLIFLPVIFGAGFSLAVLFLIKGSVSGIAIGAGSIVLGIAINYSLHFYTHYRHTGSIIQNLKDLAEPMTVGSFTTIGAFLCLLTIKSEALQDFGMFAAFSLIGASLFTLLVMPHFFKEEIHIESHKSNFIDSLSAYSFNKNRGLILVVSLATLVCLYFSQKVEFESDVMKMNYITEKLAKSENNLNRISNVSLKSVYLVSSGKNLNEALLANEKNTAELESLVQHHTIRKYSSVSSLLLSTQLQNERIDRWKKYWTTEKINRVKQSLHTHSAAFKFKASAFDSFFALIEKDYQPLSDSTFNNLKTLFLDNYISETAHQTSVVSLIKVDAQHEDAVVHAFRENESLSVFNKKYMTEKFIEIIQNNFNKILIFSSILVLITLLISYGRIELALITYLPMLISWILILGIMAICGIKFNIINIIISTFIFGLGDDYSIFIMDGLLGEYKNGKENLTSYKTSIFLSAFTTLIGIGVLIFAKHPALKSIGLITIIGMFCVLLVANTIQPLLVKYLLEKNGKKRVVPMTFIDVFITFIAYTLFIVGCILLTLIGVIFFVLIPFKSRKLKLCYHYLIMQFSRLQIYLMFNIPKKVLNPSGEDFSKPAVIIANHQSHIDLPLVMMLHPKLLILTNDWVWNNPFYGFVVKFADYYPVSNDVEKEMDLMRARVAEGYSILIFPEGTRSVNGKIQRFHKGGFYLAEKLGIDVLPIILHGASDCMTKTENFLKNGSITVSILPRIKKEDMQFGMSYQERTKAISKHFKSEFSKIVFAQETVDYHKRKLAKNYIYKGPVLEWYMRIKIKLEDNYRLFNSLLPLEGKITDIGCGYGFLTHMLSFVSEKRTVIGIDYDEEKIEVAKHCISKKASTAFFAADVTNYEFEKSDAFILSDVLHYLTANQQDLLIENCVKNLNPNGMILIRDGNKDLQKRHWGTRYTEFFSTNFGFNKTQNKLEFLSGKDLLKSLSKYKLKIEIIDNTKLTSNMIYVLRNT